MAQIADDFNKLASEGVITQDEADYLSKLADRLESALNDHDKTASVFRSLRPEHLQAAALLGIGAMSAIPMAAGGISRMVDPVRENIRYGRMRGIPHGDIPVSRDEAVIWNVDDEGMTDDEMKEAILRKAFAVTHQFAPEVTRTPEIARQFLSSNVRTGPSGLALSASGWSRDALSNEKARGDMRSARRAEYDLAAKGFRMMSPEAVLEGERAVANLNRLDDVAAASADKFI